MAIERGEIYFVNLNPTKGREQAGRRPVLVLSSDAVNQLPLVVTVVIGTDGENTRATIRPMSAFPHRIAVRRLKRCSFAFKSGRSIRRGSLGNQMGDCRLPA